MKKTLAKTLILVAVVATASLPAMSMANSHHHHRYWHHHHWYNHRGMRSGIRIYW